MEIDFTRFPCYTGIRKENRVECDIAESLADAIYRNVPGVAAGVLAHRIYTAKGAADYSAEETGIIRGCTRLFAGVYAESINDWLDDLEERDRRGKEAGS